MNPGDVVYVLYHADPGVYHTRLLTAMIAPDEWVVVTPDRDIYPEHYHDGNDDIRRFWHAADGRVPRGIPVGQVYAFARMDARQYGDLLRAGRREGDAELARRGQAPLGAAAGVAAAPPPGPAAS